MDLTIGLVFAFVYLGMVLGRVPGLALDRTGIVLLGAIALLVTERVGPTEAWESVDVPTMGLLFGLMVVSAQFRLGGFYTAVTRRLVRSQVSPDVLLAGLLAVCGALSAVLANDIVCLAVTPLVIEACARRGLKPLPFLLALACGANVGSAATLIGNPQNMLIGQKLHVSFAGYLLAGGVPSVLSLGVVWWVVRRQVRGEWQATTPVPRVEAPGFNPWQSSKGLVILVLLMVAFLFTSWPREVLALGAAGVILTSRRMHSRRMLGHVDWHLLVLFLGLFVVNHALEASGMLAQLTEAAAGWGIHVERPATLFAVSVVLSNLVSNVPAVMLLLPAAKHPLAGPILALASTLAGNLFLVGSIANIIVAEQAQHLGVRIGWRAHARIGVPVTVLTLGLAAGWLWLRWAWS